MAQYYYRSTLSKNGEGFPPSNAADKTDFENNRKSTAVRVSEIFVAQTAFVIDETYTNFSAKVSNWADVRYLERGDIYELALITQNPL